MTTLRKIESNRANAKRSTGPKTLLGKANSSRNAITHGITATTLRIRTESEEDLLTHITSYVDMLQPANQVEMDLVAVLISTSWRLRRAWATETGIFDAELSAEAPRIAEQYGKIDHHMRTSLAFKALAEDSTTWVSLDRYETRMRRAFRSALNDLHRLRHRENDDNLPNEAKKPILINTRRP